MFWSGLEPGWKSRYPAKLSLVNRRGSGFCCGLAPTTLKRGANTATLQVQHEAGSSSLLRVTRQSEGPNSAEVSIVFSPPLRRGGALSPNNVQGSLVGGFGTTIRTNCHSNCDNQLYIISFRGQVGAHIYISSSSRVGENPQTQAWHKTTLWSQSTAGNNRDTVLCREYG